MPKVIIQNLHSKTIDCPSKTEKLLDILLTETDWMHACGKKGRCTTCAVTVVGQETGLSEKSEAETRFTNLGKLKDGHRLACQVTVSGDVTIKTPNETKLPH